MSFFDQLNSGIVGNQYDGRLQNDVRFRTRRNDDDDDNDNYERPFERQRQVQMPRQKFSVFEVDPDSEKVKGKECNICLDEDNIDAQTECCKKYYHKDCLDRWLVNHESCPNCRRTLKKSFGKRRNSKSPKKRRNSKRSSKRRSSKSPKKRRSSKKRNSKE